MYSWLKHTRSYEFLNSLGLARIGIQHDNKAQLEIIATAIIFTHFEIFIVKIFQNEMYKMYIITSINIF